MSNQVKLKLLFVISGLGLGGAEVALVELCEEALRSGHSVKIVSLTVPSETFILRFDRRIEICTLNLKSIRGFVNCFQYIKNIVNRYDPDLVHSHMIHANLFMAACKMFHILDRPVIVTAHSINEGRWSFFYKFFRGYFAHAIHISKAGLDHYIKKNYFAVKNSTYIPNGVSVPEYSAKINLQRLEKRFITLGRLVKLKNHKLMIDAMINAHSIFPEVTLYIYGSGPMHDQLSNYINENFASNYIYIIQETDKPLLELSNSNFFLLSSDWEGMPMSLLEACSVGLPCVVTEVGSCKEVIEGLPLCFSSPVGDRIGYFSNVISLAGSSCDAQRIARPIIIKRILDNYTVKSSFDDLLTIYRRALIN